ncbi:MAG: exonuclease domain-containing protein [Pseudomonadota bacterium]|nr:exonuclease domain-containing protein [Pseudomonadota bacterium]
MFAPAIAFVDLETTGTAAPADRVTEVGIVRIDGGARVSEWSTLVNPECSIPPAIQALTGITNAMVAKAPTFSQIADDVAGQIGGSVFVAHNARFDYGFLKHEFGRLGRSFTAKVLCTVKLSRRLYPHAGRHNLDAVIARHSLAVSDRHRALGDARILWEFVQALYRDKPAAEIDSEVGRILKAPSLPSQLPADALDAIPEAPGVYRFYGLNALPLYVGKSINLRARIVAHFSADYRSANDMRLSAEITRIEIEETAGELGALLRESRLVKTLLPAYNHRLRRRADMVALSIAAEPEAPDYVRSDAIDPRALDDLYGPFASRRQAREALRAIAAKSALCWTALGLERRKGPCFARQVRKCAGACVGAEQPSEHHARLRDALARHALKPWPYTGTIGVRETSLAGGRIELHVFRDWCWLGTARDESELHEILEAPPRCAFDLDIYRVLVKQLPRATILPLEQPYGGGSISRPPTTASRSPTAE